MSEQQDTIRMARRNQRDGLNLAIIDHLDDGDLYRTSQEIHDGLRSQGCPHLIRDPEKAHRAVRERLVKNSRTYGQRRDDGTFYLVSRLQREARRNLKKA